MKAKAVVKELMKAQGINNVTLATRLGISSAAMWDRLNGKNKDIGVDLLREMLKAMDYKLIAVPRNARVPEEGYEVGE